MGEIRAFVGERAASPVIGIILVVAVAVILAAIIGGFVLGIGSDQETVPQAKFDFDTYDTDGDSQAEAIEFAHAGGEAFQPGTLRVQIAGETATWNEEVTVSDRFVIENSGGSSVRHDYQLSSGSVDGATATLVYVGPDGDRGAVIVEEDV